MARNIPARDLKADISSGFLSKRRVRNASGVTIAAGDVVVVVGVFDGLYLSVAPADADSASTLEGTLFVADAEIQNDAFGDVLAWKLLTGVNTAGASLNDPVYVSSTAGSWSLSGAGSSRRIGSVLAVDATEGVVLLSPGDEVPSEGRVITIMGASVVDRQLINLPESPGNTVEYHGWAPKACTLSGIEVLAITANTVGNLTLTVTNETTTNTVLSTANINLNVTGSGGVLTSNTLYTATLTSTGADLTFAAGGRWKLSLASDDAGMDGAGIYVALTFGVA